MSHSARARVAVVGPGAPVESALLDAGYAVGRELARAGALVVTGGLGGVMEAACRGAKEAGGATVGLLPGADPAAANPFVDVAIPTRLGEGRNLLVVRAADALVAVGGSWGTLVEIALAVRAGVPVVVMHGWSLTDAHGHLPAGSPRVADDAAEAVQWALDHARGR